LSIQSLQESLKYSQRYEIRVGGFSQRIAVTYYSRYVFQKLLFLSSSHHRSRLTALWTNLDIDIPTTIGNTPPVTSGRLPATGLPESCSLKYSWFHPGPAPALPITTSTATHYYYNQSGLGPHHPLLSCDYTLHCPSSHWPHHSSP